MRLIHYYLVQETIKSVLNKTDNSHSVNINNSSSNISNVRLYIKSKVANVRECPDITCKIIGQYFQNTPIDFEFRNFTTLETVPEWLEIKYQDKNSSFKTGFINKINFSLSPIINDPMSDSENPSSFNSGTEYKNYNYNKIISPYEDSLIKIERCRAFAREESKLLADKEAVDFYRNCNYNPECVKLYQTIYENNINSFYNQIYQMCLSY